MLGPGASADREVQATTEVGVRDRRVRVGEALGRRSGRDDAAAGFEDENDAGADILEIGRRNLS